MISKQWRLVGALLAVLLSACGGGGGGGSDDSAIALSFDTERVEATFLQNQEIYVNAQADAEVSVSLTAEGNVSGSIYVQVVDNNQVFAGHTALITDQDGGRFTATLRANTDLTPGTYSGTLSVNICKDASCSSKYAVTGGSLPYSVKIVPQLSLQIYVGGVQVATATSASDVIQLPYTPGTGIEIVANSTMAISTQDQPGSYTFSIDADSTDQDWKAQIDTTSGLIPGAFVYVKAGDGTGDVQREIVLYFSFSSF